MMAHKIWRELFNILKALLLIILILAVLGELMFHAPWLLDGVFFLLTGWVFYPLESAEEVTINPTAIVTAGVALVLFTLGLHLFVSWVCRANRPAGNERHWKFRSTLRVVSLIVISFVAGMSTVGVVHQITWMATTDQALLEKMGTFQVMPTFENPPRE